MNLTGVTYRRADGSFVAVVNGNPYHVTASDPLFAAASALGAGAPFEPAPPGPVPLQITQLSFIQMLYGLVTEGWISQAEAEAWRDSATLPAPIVALINTLPAEQRFLATSRAKKPSVVELSNPVLQFIAAGQGKTAQLPAFFNTYGVI